MSLIGPLTFHHTATFDEHPYGDEAFSIELEVKCTMHCDSSDDGPYATDFSISVEGGGEWSDELVEEAVRAFDLDVRAGEILMDMAPTASEIKPGVYTRIDEQGYKQRVTVIGCGKVQGRCEWLVAVERILRWGRGKTVEFLPIWDFRPPPLHDEDENKHYWKREVDEGGDEAKTGTGLGLGLLEQGELDSGPA